MTLQHIDSLCDEFEAALRKGDTLIIEDFLPKIDEAQQSDLLKELIEVEIQFAAEKTQESLRHAAESLKKRFPDQRELIQSLFQRAVKLQQIGDYEILGELGRGGMGVVYKAKHKLLQQTVAIKVLSQALTDDSQAVGRFKREMQLIGGLSHPNIVRALNAGEIDETLYLAMEFVDGITLQKLVESVRGGISGDTVAGSRAIISLGAACEAIRQAAMGLQNAHELKLVHRDIKPANLMLDHQGTVKILDLGLGKFAEERRDDYHSSLTMQGMVIGTVDYIAPEQCENSGEADVRSDLYSLGCSLYFLLTGKPVYSGSRYDTMRKKLMGHIVGEVPSLRSVIPNMPVAIEAILQKVLAKDPAERFQTPIEFAEALMPFASFDELWTLVQEVVPTDAPGTRSSSRYSNSPYGSRYATNRDVAPPPRRPRWILLVGGLCVGFIIGGLIIGAIQLNNYVSNLVSTQYQNAEQQAKERQAEWEPKREEAEQAAETARQLREEWKIAEAQKEYQTAIRIYAEQYLRTNHFEILLPLLRNRVDAALLRWYRGDASGARRDLQTILESIDRNRAEGISNAELNSLKMLVQERLADITLFGGAASRLNKERFENRISLYNDVIRIGADKSHFVVIQWKQAILSILNEDLEKATTLLETIPLPDDADVHVRLVHQLAEAVLFYYQSEDGADRNQKLRIFQRLFSAQNNATPETASQPEVLELLLFCQEFLIDDWIKHKDWETLAENIYSTSQATANFVRQYPGAIPFMRRFYELLIHSAVLVHDNSERERDKQTQIRNIVRILTQMRPSSSAGMETPTEVMFFLPESNKPEEGFVIFYPQDGREATLYPLPLTRQNIKREPPTVSALPKELLEKIATEKAAGRKIRVSWNDESAWSSAENALTDKDYPFGDALPLR